MTNGSNVDLNEDKLFVLKTHIIWKLVCAPRYWSEERVSDKATEMDPPGTSANRWSVADQEIFEGLEENPMPCNDCADRVHWLLAC